MLRISKICVWQGLTKTGKLCKGKILEKNIQAARKKLLQRDILVKNIRLRPYISINNVKTHDLLLFTRQLARLLRAGLPFLLVLELLESNTDKVLFKKFISDLILSIEQGFSISETLEGNKSFFNDFQRQLLALGEKTSTLDLMFTRIAELIEKNLQTKAKILGALFYPLSVISVAILVFLTLLIVVVPQFERLFSEVGMSLPLLTQIIISFSKHLQMVLPLLSLFFLIFVMCFLFLKKKYLIFSIKIDKFLTKIPLLKNFLAEIITARLSRTLATALASGLPLVDALHAIAQLTKNYAFKTAILSSCELLRNGESLFQALSIQKIFPREFLQFVKLGEASASIGEMLNNAADVYEERLNFFSNNFVKLLEPLLIITLGIIIGSLIIAMYLPIFNLGNVI